MARSIVVFASAPGSGKSTVAAGLAQRFDNAGRETLLLRLGSPDDPAAAADARFFADLPFGVGDPLGITQAASMLGDLGEAVIVAELGDDNEVQLASERLDASVLSAGQVDEAARSALGSRYKGYISLGAGAENGSLASMGEDPLLMAPSVNDILQSLPPKATVRFLEGNGSEVCESLLIAPISHDTGRVYFNSHGRSVVVCRDDKPEIALAALAGQAALLVISGGDEPLGYVAERAAVAGVPLAITPEGTVQTTQRIEAAFKRRPISHPRQVKRAAELLSAIDLDALLR